jgi:carbon storage regulator CsrA
VIGKGVTVTVLTIKGGAVRLGVAAPDGVTVDREEVSKRRQNGDGESDASRSKAA